MKFITITQGYRAVVDDEDFESLIKFKWYVVKPVGSDSIKYAAAKLRSNKKQKTLLMHRLIMKAEKGSILDHKDGNGLNNQKCNLRFCTTTENNRNSRLNRKNTSGFRGVSWVKWLKKYRAYISINNITVHLGVFKTAREAAIARNKKAIEIQGEFAVLNQV